MTHTAHIAAFYWRQWKRSGGEHDWNKASGPFCVVAGSGNLDWFRKYVRECDRSCNR